MGNTSETVTLNTNNPIYEILMISSDKTEIDVEYEMWSLMAIESEALRKPIILFYSE
jgi:hypothetical protein